MIELKKKRIKATLKYTWPFYILVTVASIVLWNYSYALAHRTPVNKKLSVFISGQVTDVNGLKANMLERYADFGVKEISIISSDVNDAIYLEKLTVAGYHSSDVLIIPTNILSNLKLDAFALELDEESLTTDYVNYSIYKQEEKSYGVKLNKDKLKEYVTLPEQDCFMFLNATSKNTGRYYDSTNVNNKNALILVKDWGK